MSDEFDWVVIQMLRSSGSVKFLADAPQVQRALRTELTSALDDAPEDRPLTYADVASPERVPYLEAVVAEILRCARVGEGTRRESKLIFYYPCLKGRSDIS